MANFSGIPDFLNNDSFIKWVLFGENDNYWKQFQTSYPEQAELLRQARELILKIHQSENISVPLNEQETWAKIRQAISDDKPEVKKWSTPTTRRFFSRTFWAAASVILLLGVSLFWYYEQSDSSAYTRNIGQVSEEKTLIEKINDSPNPLKIVLDDGSVVMLKQFGKISYPATPDSAIREVYLSGEAFFSVKKDPSRPFYVYANEVVTKVLGTSFTIRAFEDDPQVIVKVRSGSVSVFSQKSASDAASRELNGLIILPNQEIAYNRSEVRFSKRLVEDPLPLQDTPATLITAYEEIEVPKLLRVLEKVYGVNIIFNEDALSSCIITTNLNQQSLFESVDIICKTINANYKVIDTQVIIESGGCN